MNQRRFAPSEWEEMVLTALESLEVRLGRIESHLQCQGLERPARPEPQQARDPAAMISTAEAADYLGLKPQTLRGWRVTGGGPPYIRYGKKGRGAVYYRISDIDAWVDERRWPHTSAETVGYRPGRD